MNIDAKSIIELAGGAALVLSLVFVGLQLQQGNIIAERETRAEIPTLTMEINRLALDEPEVASLLEKLRSAEPDLTNEEANQAFSLAGMYQNLWATTNSAVDSGFVPDNVLSIYIGNVTRTLEIYPGLCPFMQLRIHEEMRQANLGFYTLVIEELDKLNCPEWEF